MVEFLNNNNSGFNQWNANKNAKTKSGGLGGFFWWLLIFLASWWLLSSWLNPNSKKVTVDETNAVAPVVDLSGVPQQTIESDKINANLQGLRISNVKLSEFADGKSDDVVTLISGDGAYIEVGLTPTGTTAPDVKTKWTKNKDGYTWRNKDGVVFNRVTTINDYVITITDKITNNSNRDFGFAPYTKIVRANDMKSSAGVYTGSVAYANNKLEHKDWVSFDKKSYAYSTTNGFAGFVDQYWETVASIDSPDQTMRIKKAGDLYNADITAGQVSIAPGKTESITTNIYVGPRDNTILKSVENVIPGIKKSIDYGWFWFLAQPMVWALNGLNAFVGNYGVAIILLTLLIRLLMWPLTRKSYTSMMDMQKLQPEMQRIQKLYANDKQRQQIEIARLYQTHKTSPMSGCLPMLIQLPIFFALYKALLVSIQMRNANFLWIHDLSAMDPYFILPILMGLTMWLQQILQTPQSKTSDKNDVTAQTQKVMKWMPLLFTLMFVWMPAGLVLYWTVSNIFGIGQMYFIKKNTK